MKTKVLNSLKITAFVTFFFVIIWVYFFKCNFQRDLYFFFVKSRINWNPFSELVTKTGEFDISGLWLLVLNIFGFIFWGFYAAGFFKKKQILWGTLIGFGASFIVEVLQYSLGFGGAALGDLIYNTIGAAIGAIVYYFCYKKNIKPIVYNVIYIVSIGLSIICIILGIVFTVKMWPEYTYFC